MDKSQYQKINDRNAFEYLEIGFLKIICDLFFVIWNLIMVNHRKYIRTPNRAILILVFGLLFINSSQLFAQAENIPIGRDFDQLSWNDFVNRLEKEKSIRFFFEADSIPEFTVHIASDSSTLEEVLQQNLGPLNISAAFDKNGNVFITINKPLQTSFPPNFFDAMDKDIPTIVAPESKADTIQKFLATHKEYVTRTIVVGTKKKGVGKKTATVSGFVKRSEDGLPVIGATLFVEELKTGTSTNVSGYFSLTLKKGKHTLIVSSVDSEEEKYEMELLSDGRLDVSLDKKIYSLKEVVITSEQEDNIRSTQMGYEKLSAKSVKEIPTVMGERDIIKVALLLPGVQSVGEGAAGYNVRGSPADQNVFYMNNIPVYNVSHLMGFFTAFTPEAIDEFTLYKSNIPAKYGGRLSSIFDIKAKEGNKKKFSMRGGISPITGSLMVEGPFAEDKSSYMIAVRSTYSDWILKLIDNYEIQNSKAYFADAVANFSIALNPNNQLKILTYFSYDDISLVSNTRFDYQNQGASVGWEHIINNKHNLDLTFVYAKYAFNEENEELKLAAYKQNYSLNHNEVRANFTLRPNNKHQISVGFNSILYLLDRGNHLPLNDESLTKAVYLGSEQGIETGIYIDEEWTISPLFSVSGGFRYNIYAYLGPQTIYEYGEGLPMEPENIVDTVSYGNNEIVQSYSGPDFRLAAKYIFTPNLSIKASFNQMHQYIFMLSNTIALSPTDKWKLVDSHIKPMKGQQYAFGIFSNFAKGRLEFSAEAYYKRVENLVEYKDGADLLVNEVIETDVLQGDLDAYGIEFMLRKPFGRFNGWINYTYSSSNVLVTGSTPSEMINFGNSYPANYDKPHALNLVMNYKFSRRLSVSSNVVYATGRPVTYPTAIYYQDGVQIIHYSARNEFRLPDYFRIDFSVNLEGNLKKKKAFHGSWNFSVYNLTGRKNAYSVYFKSEDGKINGYKLSIFGSPIISLTYNFKLGNYEN